MKRPARPQIRQQSHMPGLFSGQRGNPAALGRGGTSIAVAFTFPPSDDAGEAIKREL